MQVDKCHRSQRTGFLLGFFSGGSAAKIFQGAPPPNFPGQTILGGGGKIFLKKMKFSHRVEISIISVFQYYSTIKTHCKLHRID